MVDSKTKEFIQGKVKEYCSPDMIHATLRHFEDQLEEAEGDKRIVVEAFIEGIKRSLGKI